jgi:probable HAF family extracellular repeat protein
MTSMTPRISIEGAIATYAHGINDAGQIVGAYDVDANTERGFLATPVR